MSFACIQRQCDLENHKLCTYIHNHTNSYINTAMFSTEMNLNQFWNVTFRDGFFIYYTDIDRTIIVYFSGMSGYMNMQEM